MGTIYVNSRNSKTSDPHRLLFNHSDKTNFKRKNISQHSHKKRNSLDTRAVFIECLKYVENSGVVVY